MSQEWFRSWRGAPKDEKWLAVAAEAGVPRSLVVALVWCLLDHGGSRPFTERGSVAGIKPRVLAAWLECSTDEVERIMAALVEFGFMTDTEILHWDDYQPAREDNSTERVRAFRARKKANGADPHPPGGAPETRNKTKRDETHRNGTVTRRHAPESESESESERKGTSTRAHAHARKPDLDAALPLTSTPDLKLFYEKGRSLLGPHSEQLLADVLAAKGSLDRAIAAIEHATAARSPRRYLQQVAADPPFTPPLKAKPKKPNMLEIAGQMRRMAAARERDDGNVVDFPLLNGTGV